MGWVEYIRLDGEAKQERYFHTAFSCCQRLATFFIVLLNIVVNKTSGCSDQSSSPGTRVNNGHLPPLRITLEIRPTQQTLSPLTQVPLCYHESHTTDMAIRVPKRAGRLPRQGVRQCPAFTSRGVPETLTIAPLASFLSEPRHRPICTRRLGSVVFQNLGARVRLI